MEEGRTPESAVISPQHVRLHAPITPRLLRDFLAFRSHVIRTRIAMGSKIPEDWDRIPSYYNGNPYSLYGPEDSIPVPRYMVVERGERREIATEKLDYEAEVGFVVGVGGRSIDAERAAAHLFGVTVFNDFSARDIQLTAGRIGMGPGPAKDFANALGPCIVTRDEFGALREQHVTVRVNGEQRLNGRYRQLVFENPLLKEGERPVWSFDEMVAFVSQSQEVRAGEVWGSGTIPGGCELERGEDARYLSPGDRVEIAIEGIGILRNVVAPD
jgi:2-keto-4-pentenoate hydratase/2-oxohepta-3-ene-1,7-dioic acid hydratase in catechol pathway